MIPKKIILLEASRFGTREYTPAAGGPDFQEGLWEITSVSEMPGMGKMKITNKMTGRRIGNCK